MKATTDTRDFGRGRSLLKISALVATATVLAAGSAFAQQAEGARDGAKEEAEVMRLAANNAPVELYVRNNNWLDARIYAVRQGTRYRLGTVTSFQIERFELPSFVTSDVDGVQILVLPIGSGASYVTEEIPALAGDVLALELEQHLPLSAFYRAR